MDTEMETVDINQLSNDRLMMRIMILAYLIQRKTKYVVFLHWSGHVDQLDISIRKSKEEWQTKMLETEFYTEYAKARHDSEPFRAELISKVTVLQRVLEDEEIPYDIVDEETYQYSEYSF